MQKVEDEKGPVGSIINQSVNPFIMLVNQLVLNEDPGHSLLELKRLIKEVDFGVPSNTVRYLEQTGPNFDPDAYDLHIAGGFEDYIGKIFNHVVRLANHYKVDLNIHPAYAIRRESFAEFGEHTPEFLSQKLKEAAPALFADVDKRTGKPKPMKRRFYKGKGKQKGNQKKFHK